MYHGARWRPLEYAEICKRSENWHHDCFEYQLKTYRAIPGHEERVLINELASLGL